MFKNYLILILTVLSLWGCKPKSEENSNVAKKIEKEQMVPVTVIEAENSTYNEYGEYYGKVKGITSASIINVLNGTVEIVNVKEGSLVKEGDSLGEISSEKAKLMLETAILNEKISRDNYNTLKDFLSSGNSSQVKVDTAHLQWLNSKSQLVDAQKAYDSSLCISPIDGVVVTRNIDVEDEVYQGQESFLIEDLSRLVIEVGIPEADMVGVKEGNVAEVTLDLFPDRVWKGVLTRFSRKSSNNSLTFKAVIEIDNSDGVILSGTTAKVKLLRNSYTDSVVIPTDVVISENYQSYVMVVNNNRVNKRSVVLGPSGIESVVVLSGLEPGEKVVQEGKHLLMDSQLVEIRESGV